MHNYERSEKTKKTIRENEKKRTSDANDNLFSSPPDIPLIRPGIPITVSLHFVRPS